MGRAAIDFTLQHAVDSGCQEVELGTPEKGNGRSSSANVQGSRISVPACDGGPRTTDVAKNLSSSVFTKGRLARFLTLQEGPARQAIATRLRIAAPVGAGLSCLFQFAQGADHGGPEQPSLAHDVVLGHGSAGHNYSSTQRVLPVNGRTCHYLEFLPCNNGGTDSTYGM